MIERREPEVDGLPDLKLIDVLEDNDDVQVVSANFEISDDTLAKLTA